jgi:hypothetical protein
MDGRILIDHGRRTVVASSRGDNSGLLPPPSFISTFTRSLTASVSTSRRFSFRLTVFHPFPYGVPLQPDPAGHEALNRILAFLESIREKAISSQSSR